jgi:single-strand DNA-binding protein
MINKATILGRIGKKDYKPTKNGSHVCMLSIATNRKYLDAQGQKREITTWHNVNLFNRLADIGNKYAHVGDLIYVEGEIVNKKIDENGQSRIIHSITGSEVKLIPTGKKAESAPEANGNTADDYLTDEGDLPF